MSLLTAKTFNFGPEQDQGMNNENRNYLKSVGNELLVEAPFHVAAWAVGALSPIVAVAYVGTQTARAGKSLWDSKVAADEEQTIMLDEAIEHKMDERLAKIEEDNAKIRKENELNEQRQRESKKDHPIHEERKPKYEVKYDKDASGKSSVVILEDMDGTGADVNEYHVPLPEVTSRDALKSRIASVGSILRVTVASLSTLALWNGGIISIVNGDEDATGSSADDGTEQVDDTGEGIGDDPATSGVPANESEEYTTLYHQTEYCPFITPLGVDVDPDPSLTPVYRESVEDLQSHLGDGDEVKEPGELYPYEIDGIFGDKTASAVYNLELNAIQDSSSNAAEVIDVDGVLTTVECDFIGQLTPPGYSINYFDALFQRFNS